MSHALGGFVKVFVLSAVSLKKKKKVKNVSEEEVGVSQKVKGHLFTAWSSEKYSIFFSVFF